MNPEAEQNKTIQQKLLEAEQEVDRLTSLVVWMESSKFWKARLLFVLRRDRLFKTKFFRYSREMIRRLGRPSLTRLSAKENKGINYRKHFAKNLRTVETSGYFAIRPLISIIMPVFNSSREHLVEAIESVMSQTYEHWQLCIADDASSEPYIREILEAYSKASDKILVTYRLNNGHISEASNTALSTAKGEFVAFLDHDDVLFPQALMRVVAAINSDPSVDFIYTDEAQIDGRGLIKNPFYKPDWSPELLLSQNYICHLSVIRNSLVTSVEGFRKGFEGAQDHDLFLRITERTSRILHISEVLYLWRNSSSSTSSSPSSKPYAQNSAINALKSYATRKGLALASISSDPEHLFVYDFRQRIENYPTVSIIIPTRDNVDLLESCVQSILNKTDYDRSKYEIVILDNNSVEESTFLWFQDISNFQNVRILPADYDFNFSKINNHGVSESSGEVLIFLNNDTEIIEESWMARLVEHAVRPEVGIAGGLLFYGDGTIQHAGVVVGMGGWADHIFKGMSAAHLTTPYVSPLVKRNVLAVTGACMAISRETFYQIGGFDETATICGTDVELCLRAHESGYQNIYDPYVRLYHYESKSRDPQKIPLEDFEFSKRKYSQYLKDGDAFFNKKLSLSHVRPTSFEFM